PGFRPRAALLAQLAFAVAVLGPALAAGSVRPSTLGLVTVPLQLPVKIAGAILFLLALPAVLGLLPATRSGALLTRAALWLPCCGLGASLYVPAGGADVGGLLLFAAASAATGTVAVAGARLLPGIARSDLYWAALAGVAAVTLALAAVAAARG
ncbi:MAG: hypothetical protein M3024_11090, partial [Candidatus Dormibacteraeota bacterium]|nr:hypothetical protein [Candidatus Dormibacteraeota bacterium]